MPLYDVSVESPGGVSGDTVRVLATDEDAAKATAAASYPSNWEIVAVEDIAPAE